MSAIAAIEAEMSRVLNASSEVTNAFGVPARIFDAEVRRAAFPFIRFARHEMRPEESMAEGPVDHRITLEVYSRNGGRDEASRLVHLVTDTLRQSELQPSGHGLILFYPLFIDVFLRPDGNTYRGLLRLRALSEPME